MSNVNVEIVKSKKEKGFMSGKNITCGTYFCGASGSGDRVDCFIKGMGYITRLKSGETWHENNFEIYNYKECDAEIKLTTKE